MIDDVAGKFFAIPFTIFEFFVFMGIRLSKLVPTKIINKNPKKKLQICFLFPHIIIIKIIYLFKRIYLIQFNYLFDIFKTGMQEIRLNLKK